jgi:hypothetical protein
LIVCFCFGLVACKVRQSFSARFSPAHLVSFPKSHILKHVRSAVISSAHVSVFRVSFL